MSRHARQLQALGPAGHARIRAGQVIVRGRDLAAEVAAAYLAGAGVSRIAAAPSILAEVEAVDPSVEREILAGDHDFGVALGSRTAPSFEGSSAARGARAARWALAALLEDAP